MKTLIDLNDLRQKLEGHDISAVAATLGFTHAFHPLKQGALANRDDVQAFAASKRIRLYVVCEDDPTRRQALVRAVHKQAPLDATLWWFTGDQNRFSMAETLADGRIKIATLMTGARPKDAAVQQIGRLAVDVPSRPNDVKTQAVREHWQRVLDAELLTREFFKAFSSLLGLMTRALKNGPSDPQQRHEVALINLLRMVFVYFLQRRGALAGDPEFVLKHWLSGAQQGDFYGQVLRPLFFGLLNTPLDARDPGATSLGQVPFLNGGLFEALPTERAHPNLTWPNEVWKAVIEDVFERYPFALAGSDDQETVRAIDPEMLGKVFEGLMYGDRRADSGSYYTPRDVVNDLVDGALVRQLAEKSGIAAERLQLLLQTESAVMTVGERVALRAGLGSFRVLDPACGTGAFLLAATHLLAKLWSLVEGRPIDHVLLRDVVHQHIFGVDIEHTAVRLCELRLWLAILSKTPAMKVAHLPPLPNLGHRILTGNSLLDPLDVVQPGHAAYDRDWMRAQTTQIADLQAQWLQAHGEPKQALASVLADARRQLQCGLVRAQLRHLDAQGQALAQQSESKDLFGQPLETAAHEEDLAQFRSQRQQLQSLLDGLENDRASAVAFSYASAFPDVDGFDVIVTNPPWIRSNRLASETKRQLFQKYECCSSAMWAGAAARGIHAPYGAQIDVANIFMERSLDLLKPSGRLAALVPAKMFRSLQGTGIRRVMSKHRVYQLQDFSESSRQLFDATTYPAAIELVKAVPQPQEHANIVIWQDSKPSRFQTTAVDFATSAPWPLIDSKSTQIFEQMQNRDCGRALDPQRGIFTGRNQVFVRNASVWESLLGPDSPHVRTVLTGRDPNGESGKQILFAYGDAGQPLRDVPDEVRHYLAAHQTRLMARSGHRADLPLWQLFRVRRDITKPKVVWRDMSVFLETSIAPDGAIPLNTLYYLPCESVAQAQTLQAFLRSVPVLAFAREFGERARGGWRRHFAWLMRMLPVPVELWRWVDSGHVPSHREICDAYGLNAHQVDHLRTHTLAGREVANSVA